MSPSVDAIKRHLQEEAKAQGRKMPSTIAQALTESPQGADCPIAIPKRLYVDLVNHLRHEIMKHDPKSSEEICALPVIQAWVAQGMGLAHSFATRQELLSGHPYDGSMDFDGSLLEELWQYTDGRPQKFPEPVVKGILSNQGVVNELSNYEIQSPLGKRRCVVKSCPELVESKNWRLWDANPWGPEAEWLKKLTGKEPALKSSRFSNRNLEFLPVHCLDIVGADHYHWACNYRRSSDQALSDRSLKLLLAISKTEEDLQLLDKLVIETCEGWESTSVGIALSQEIRSDFFWGISSRDLKAFSKIEDFWITRAIISAQSDLLNAPWAITLFAALYERGCPEPKPELLDKRRRHLDDLLARHPSLVGLVDLLITNAGFLGSLCFGRDPSKAVWADEVFLGLMPPASRKAWVDALSKALAEDTLQNYKKGSLLVPNSQEAVEWFFKTRSSDFAKSFCDHLLSAASISRMRKDYPRAGLSVVEMATYDLKRPERRDEAVALINTVRSSDLKVRLIGYLGVPPKLIKLTALQLERVFSQDIGL